MSLSKRYDELCERIGQAARASGRSPEDVRLVAVSKRQPEALVSELAELGHRDFGENQVQAWQGRLALDLPAGIRWHLIGPLQTNKAKFVARTPPALLHTLDRAPLVDALERRLQGPAPLDTLLQVNVDREAQKSGCLPEDLDALVDRVAQSSRLRLRGLMAIPRHPSGGEARAAFAALRELLDGVRDRVVDTPILSMGMSGDFEAAIAEGSTLVRVGRAIFGQRD
jgi:pyridoxal phosphate enzyme (YggS family)